MNVQPKQALLWDALLKRLSIEFKSGLLTPHLASVREGEAEIILGEYRIP